MIYRKQKLVKIRIMVIYLIAFLLTVPYILSPLLIPLIVMYIIFISHISRIGSQKIELKKDRVIYTNSSKSIEIPYGKINTITSVDTRPGWADLIIKTGNRETTYLKNFEKPYEIKEYIFKKISEKI